MVANPEKEDSNTDFDLDGGFEETAEIEGKTDSNDLQLEEDGSETITDERLSTEPLFQRRPDKPLKSKIKPPPKPKKSTKPISRTAPTRVDESPSPARKPLEEDEDFESLVAKKTSKSEPLVEPRMAPEKTIAPAPVKLPLPAPTKTTPAKPITTRRRWDDDDDDSQGHFKRIINSKWGKRIILPLGAITILYLMYDLFFDGASASDIAAKAKDTAYPVPPDRVYSAEQLWDEYANDNTGANRKFTESFIEVSGHVRAVSTDKQLAVVLETPSAEAGIVCLFPVRDYFEGVKVGDVVTIQGEGSTRAKLNTDIQLNVCKIKPKK